MTPTAATVSTSSNVHVIFFFNLQSSTTSTTTKSTLRPLFNHSKPRNLVRQLSLTIQSICPPKVSKSRAVYLRMSPRTEKYLALCLDQADKSTLHYRHGSIIVRGGKVIGQGYNSYRNGYDGGALKTGKLAARGLGGPATAEQKTRMKHS